MLSKLGKRNPALALTPFDMVRCTWDGLLDLVENGFHHPGKYIPLSQDSSGSTSSVPNSSVSMQQKYFIPDAASIWLLFRSQHACFTHFDLNRPEAMSVIQQRIQAWEALLSPRSVVGEHSAASVTNSNLTANASGIQRFAIFRRAKQQEAQAAYEEAAQPHRLPNKITFLRTIMAQNPQEELALVPRFHQLIRERTKGTVQFRTVMIMHDQESSTVPVCCFPDEARQFNSPCVVWNLKRDRAASENGRTSSLLDQCHAGYERIIQTMSGSETEWEQLIRRQPLPSLETYLSQRKTVFTPYRELSLISGVPAVQGTCTGFGSTRCGVHPGDPCPHCGSVDGHALDSMGLTFDTGRAWTDDDVGELLLAFAMSGGDEVATVEAIAQQQGRGGSETWLKLREVVSGGQK